METDQRPVSPIRMVAEFGGWLLLLPAPCEETDFVSAQQVQTVLPGGVTCIVMQLRNVIASSFPMAHTSYVTDC